MRDYGLWKQPEGFREEGVGKWDRPVMGSKEGMYCMVHWVLYTTSELWDFTSKTSDVLYGDKHNIIKKYY